MTPGRELGIPVSVPVLVALAAGVEGSTTILVGVNAAVRESVPVGTIEVAPVDG